MPKTTHLISSEEVRFPHREEYLCESWSHRLQAKWTCSTVHYLRLCVFMYCISKRIKRFHKIVTRIKWHSVYFAL